MLWGNNIFNHGVQLLLDAFTRGISSQNISSECCDWIPEIAPNALQAGKL
jgi:hypothetical protein